MTEVGRSLITCLLVCGLGLLQQFPGRQEFEDALTVELVIDFVTHNLRKGVPVDNFLSPALTAIERERNLALIRRKFDQISVRAYEGRDVEILDPAHARLRAQVTWRSEGKTDSYVTTIYFEKHDDRWYFADFSFLVRPLIPENVKWVLPIVLLILGFFALRFWLQNRKTTATLPND